jgi:hypothetical protein
LSSPAIEHPGVVARPKPRPRAALSLQNRATLAIILGISAIGGFVALAIGDDQTI